MGQTSLTHEDRHGGRAILRLPDVGERTTDEDCAAAAEQAREEATDDLSSYVFAERQHQEDDDEAAVGGKVDLATTDELAERSQEQRSNRAGRVESASARGP